MKELVRKEFTLAVGVLYLFALLSLVIFIPNYPLVVGIFYSFMPIQLYFNWIRTNKDIEFTLLLPVRRKDVVLSKIFVVIFFEAAQLAVAVVAALVRRFAYPLTGDVMENIVGLDANFTFFGVVLLALSAQNLILFPMFFKTGYKLGKPLVLSFLALVLIEIVFEFVIGFVPALHNVLDGYSGEYIGYRLIVLLIGIAAFCGGTYLAGKLSVKAFEKVSL